MSDAALIKPSLPRFNPFASELRVDPYRIYKVLREQNPVHRVLGMWVITKHADTLSALRNRACSSSVIPKQIDAQAEKHGMQDAAFQRLAYKSIVFTDNPDHQRLRKLINLAFTGEAIEELVSLIEGQVRELVSKARRQGGMDVVSDLAHPLPLQVMCKWMGLPDEIQPSISKWTHSIRFLLEPGLMSGEDFSAVSDILDEYMAYLTSIIAARRVNPGHDLISKLILLEIDGECLSQEELVFVCVMCFVAGNETTKSLIGNTLLSVLSHPDQYLLLRQQPVLVGAAVLESLRFETPLQHTKRVAMSDVIVGGNQIKAGEQILLCLGSANRDEEVFPAADSFNIQRSAKANLGFGYGMHGCLGGLLAERQTQEVLNQLLNGPAMALRTTEPKWSASSFIVRSLECLELQFI